jgi:hypothetical protein
MRWFARTIVPYSGTPSEDITLYYRDPLDAVQWLLDRPDLFDHMEFIPRRVRSNDEEKQRIYSEIFTGDWAWTTQVSFGF